MRAWIAYAATLFLLISGLSAPPAAAEPSPDAAPNPGVAAYDAGEYERAFELLKPAADAGDAKARYLMARLLSGDLGETRDYPKARAYLDLRTRCRSPSALALFAYVSWKAGPNDDELLSVAYAYKEAARAGVLEAHTGLGILLVRELKRPLEGSAYLLEASRLGEPNAIEFIELMKASDQGAVAFERLGEIVEEQSFEGRWPLLDDDTTQCRF